MANCRIDLFHVFWTRTPYGVEYHGNDLTGLHDEIYSLRLAWWRLLGLRGLNPWKWGADGSRTGIPSVQCNSPCKSCNQVGFPTSNEMHSLTARRTASMAYPRILRSLPTDKRPPLGLPPGQIVFRIRSASLVPLDTFFLLTLPTRSLRSTISVALDCLQTLSRPPNSLSFVSNQQPLFERHSLELVPRNFPK